MRRAGSGIVGQEEEEEEERMGRRRKEEKLSRIVSVLMMIVVVVGCVRIVVCSTYERFLLQHLWAAVKGLMFRSILVKVKGHFFYSIIITLLISFLEVSVRNCSK